MTESTARPATNLNGSAIPLIPFPAMAELRSLPIAQLYESPHNPRKRFDQAKLEELAQSIRAQGVRVPLTVRTNLKGPFTYEIVAGHRRYRAAKIAGLAEVPALIHTLSDQQALEIMTIDNLQRDDVHQLEEADGFQALLAMKRRKGVLLLKKLGAR